MHLYFRLAQQNFILPLCALCTIVEFLLHNIIPLYEHHVFIYSPTDGHMSSLYFLLLLIELL